MSYFCFYSAFNSYFRTKNKVNEGSNARKILIDQIECTIEYWTSFHVGLSPSLVLIESSKYIETNFQNNNSPGNSIAKKNRERPHGPWVTASHRFLKLETIRCNEVTVVLFVTFLIIALLTNDCSQNRSNFLLSNRLKYNTVVHQIRQYIRLNRDYEKKSPGCNCSDVIWIERSRPEWKRRSQMTIKLHQFKFMKQTLKNKFTLKFIFLQLGQIPYV